tara:strand:+ start:432 stop:569 length:138 start_codon:yes stop_codon:yes gene_type:complete
MSDEKINLRMADITDCKDIFAWRSDQLSRSMSFTDSITSFEQHKA